MQEKNYSQIETNSTQTELDKVLDKIGNETKQVEKGIEDKVLNSQIKDKQDKAESQATNLFRDLGWYLKIIKKPVLILAALEIGVYGLSLFAGLKNLMLDFFDPLLLIVDLVVFGWIFARVKKKDRSMWWPAAVSVFLAGFSLGLIVSIFKFFWFREYWTVFNLIIEPVFTGLIAGAVGLIVNIFMRREKSELN